MDLLRTLTYQPASTGAGGSSSSTNAVTATKMSEQALGKACSGESRRKKAAEPEQQQQHHHHHSHAATEVSRIITDPTTGRRYCRGKVLGKVNKCPEEAAARGMCCRTWISY